MVQCLVLLSVSCDYTESLSVSQSDYSGLPCKLSTLRIDGSVDRQHRLGQFLSSGCQEPAQQTHFLASSPPRRRRLRGVMAMPPIRPTTALKPLGRPRPSAQAAVHPAATVHHRRPTARAAISPPR